LTKPLVLLDFPLPAFLEEPLSPHCQLVQWETINDKTNQIPQPIEGMYTYAHPRVDGRLLDQLPGLRVISNYGVGVDHIDLNAAFDRKIAVGNTPGAVDGATADMTMTLLLAAARNLILGDRYARGPEFTLHDPSRLLGKEVYGSTLGIIGMGRVGTQVAKRARGFDMKVIYYNRRRNLEAENSLGVFRVSFDELLRESDFVCLNVPLTPETRNLMGESEFRKMRKDAILVNAARGPVIDHQALYRALSEQWIAGAALDVTDPEPLPRDHPLLTLANLVISPHLGSATVKTRCRMGEMAMANLLAGLRGKPLPFPVGVGP